MSQIEVNNYESIVEIVSRWPVAQRFSLVQDVLKTLAPDVERPRPRERTLEKALSLVPLSRPAPTDEEVKQWLEEHRMEKYG